MGYRLLRPTKSLATQFLPRHDIIAPLFTNYHLRSLRIIRPCNATSCSPLLSSAFYKHLHHIHNTAATTKEETKYTKSTADGSRKVLATSPSETTAMKELKRALDAESLKTRRYAQSKKITYTLILALLVVSKSNLLTSILVLSVYWQIYGFFKEIFQDYIHHEVTHKWVLTYFAVLLIILVKDTLLYYDLV